VATAVVLAVQFELPHQRYVTSGLSLPCHTMRQSLYLAEILGRQSCVKLAGALPRCALQLVLSFGHGHLRRHCPCTPSYGIHGRRFGRAGSAVRFRPNSPAMTATIIARSAPQFISPRARSFRRRRNCRRFLPPG
jgi:hypothetical protein